MATAADHRFSAMVRDEADVRGIKHQKLADVADLHRVALHDRLRGRTRWTLSEMTALALFLDLDMDVLLYVPADDDPEVIAS